MPSLMMDSLPQLQAAGAWGSLCSVQEPVKPRHVLIPAAPAKKPAYGVGRKNLETCTEVLGCETGAVDVAPAPAGNSSDDGDGDGCIVEAERKSLTRENEEEEEAMAGRVRGSERRGPLPPPLTTLAPGASRVRMVQERRDGRLEVYAVRAPGVLEAERSDGRLRLRLLPLPCCGAGDAAAACCCRKERSGPAEAEEEAKEGAEEEYGGFSKYVRGGRCMEPKDGAAAARRGKQWQRELCQYPCIF